MRDWLAYARDLRDRTGEDAVPANCAECAETPENLASDPTFGTFDPFGTTLPDQRRPEWAGPKVEPNAPLRLDRDELLTYFDERAASRQDGGMTPDEASAAATADVIEAIKDGRIKPLDGKGIVTAEISGPSPYLSGQLGEWQRALLDLPHDIEPAPGIRKWPEVRRAALTFLETRGVAALDLGWDALTLFGVLAKIGIVRADAIGALMASNGSPVVEVTADAIGFESGLKYRRHSWPAGVLPVPIWSFVR